MEEALTLAWTNDDCMIYRTINSALQLDTAEYSPMPPDSKAVLEGNLQAVKNDSKGVLECSLKYMRIFNNILVHKGTPLNTENRTVYRGCGYKALKDVKVGDKFRIPNYL